jgi:nucleoid-associated protein YgaU
VTLIGFTAILSPLDGITPKALFPDGMIVLPCVLNDIDVAEEADIRDYSTVGAGDFTQSAGKKTSRKLQSVSLETMLTAAKHPFIYDTNEPVDVTELRVRRVLRGRAPFQLGVRSIGRYGFPEVDFPATMRSLSRSRKAGSPEVLWLTMAFMEWRDPSGVERAKGSTLSKVGSKLPLVETVKAGDTLESLSMKHYGTYSLWRVIAKANGLKGATASTALLPLIKRIRIPVRPTRPKPAAKKHHK